MSGRAARRANIRHGLGTAIARSLLARFRYHFTYAFERSLRRLLAMRRTMRAE
jgi:hypothetical protein